MNDRSPFVGHILGVLRSRRLATVDEIVADLCSRFEYDRITIAPHVADWLRRATSTVEAVDGGRYRLLPRPEA